MQRAELRRRRRRRRREKALSHPPSGQGVAIKQKLASTCFKNSIDDDDICLLSSRLRGPFMISTSSPHLFRLPERK
jgi:hypothetical protein